MDSNMVYPAQLETQSFGFLQVNVNSILGSRPVRGATVKISYGDDPNAIVEEVKTDISGQTEPVELEAPSLDYSMEPSVERPYSVYQIEIIAPGFETIEISGAELLPNQLALQEARMIPLDNAVGEGTELFVIPPHTLYGDYPPKIAEEEIKPTNEQGEIVLSRVVIPEFIIVHDGPPTDRSAKNHYVKYKDYIKNVASSEIYATWPGFTKPIAFDKIKRQKRLSFYIAPLGIEIMITYRIYTNSSCVPFSSFLAISIRSIK